MPDAEEAVTSREKIMSSATRKTYESPRQRARRAAILKTTREILAKNGYDRTTIRDIATQAGVAKGTLYNIYGGKDGLIVSAIVDVREDIGKRAIEEFGASRGIGCILTTDHAMIDQIVENPTYAEAVARAMFGAQAAALLVPNLIDVPIGAQARYLEVAKESGEIDPNTDIESLARQLVIQAWGMLLALCVERLSAEELQGFAAHAIVRVLRSVVKPEAQAQLDEHLARFG